MRDALRFAAGPRGVIRRLPPDLERVCIVLAAPPSAAQLAWLRAHLAALPSPLRLDVTTLGAARGHDLRALERALERPIERRQTRRPLEVALGELEQVGGYLPVVFGLPGPRGGGADWALRRARGAVLIVPDLPDPPPTWPHVEVVARDAAEVEALAPWAALLPPGATVTVRASADVLVENPLRFLAEAAALERAVRGANEGLSDLGLVPRAACAPDDAVDPPATLVIRVARRGLLRRWWPGRDARALRRDRRPLLLVP